MLINLEPIDWYNEGNEYAVGMFKDLKGSAFIVHILWIRHHYFHLIHFLKIKKNANDYRAFVKGYFDGVKEKQNEL